MKVKELKDFLSNLPESYDSWEVKVETSPLETIIGPMPTVDIRQISVGIDWDNGKIIISPTPQLVEKSSCVSKN